MKRYICIIAGMLLTIACIVYQSSCIHKLSAERDRLTNNQEALLAECDTFRTKSMQSAARVQQLELTAAEFEAHCAELQEQVQQLGIKNKYLQNLASAGAETAASIKTRLKDSIVFVQVYDTIANEVRGYVRDTIKCFNYDDGWIEAHGCIYNNNVLDAEFTSRDTLTMVAYRVPKRFLFIKYGTKRIEMSVTSTNPHTKINYAKYINFAKK